MPKGSSMFSLNWFAKNLILKRSPELQKTICTCAILQKRDKYSLKNIGSKRVAFGGGRKKAPSYKKYGGSKEFPVTLFQLPKLGSDEMELEKGSRHKLMIENALKIAVESLIFSEKFSEILTGCPIEVTKVDLATNFSSASVYWRLDKTNNGPTEDDIKEVFDQNIEFIRNMLPAYHSMTHTPFVIFQQDLTMEREKDIDEALKSIKQQDCV